MLTPSIISVGFSVYKAYYYKTLYGPAQCALVKLHFCCKLCNGCVSLLFNGKKQMTLCYGNTAADRISIKLFSKFTLELANTFPELFYILVAYIFS